MFDGVAASLPFSGFLSGQQERFKSTVAVGDDEQLDLHV
jgi:hypothetical protein